MVYVNDTACNGCGECVDVCPTGALIFQNNRAYIDQDLCQCCEICMEACPMGAILSGEAIPVNRDIIQVPEIAPEHFASQRYRSNQTFVRDMVLPVVGSILLWTGRELVPRLADAALGYLDRRLQSSQSASTQKFELHGDGLVSPQSRRYGHGRRRRRHRKNRRSF